MTQQNMQHQVQAPPMSMWNLILRNKHAHVPKYIVPSTCFIRSNFEHPNYCHTLAFLSEKNVEHKLQRIEMLKETCSSPNSRSLRLRHTYFINQARFIHQPPKTLNPSCHRSFHGGCPGHAPSSPSPRPFMETPAQALSISSQSRGRRLRHVLFTAAHGFPAARRRDRGAAVRPAGA